MSPFRDEYDVVVVGARCAGAATARLLAEEGLDVLLVDRTRLPADTVSTHALLLGATIQLRRWGLLDAVIATGATAVDGVTIDAGGTHFTAPIKHIGGVDRVFAPRRIVLDALLADAAVAAGAELLDGHTVHGLGRDASGRISSVHGTDEGGRAWSVRTRYVVGADGVRSSIAEHVDAELVRYDAATAAGHYAYFRGMTGSTYEFAFAPDAGAGAIPTDDGLTCVYIQVPVATVPTLRRDPEQLFMRTVRHVSPSLADRVADAERVGSYRGSRGLPAYLRRAAGPGWLLAGDAGYHRDPYSAHGITDAFRDAELAARAITAAIGDDVPESVAMRHFESVRDDFATPMYDLTKRLASFELDYAGILDVLDVMGDVGEREARMLTSLDDQDYLERVS
jgi:flavin-dependent dehydrogenase